jgi:amino acid transporter
MRRARYFTGKLGCKSHPNTFGFVIQVIFGGLIIVVLAGIFYNNIDTIASVVNFGNLFTYLCVHLSLIKLRKSKPEIKRAYKVPLYPAIPLMGATCCILLKYYLSDNAKIASVLRFLTWLLVFAIMTKRKTERKQTVGS